ncbi:restriction endonuclease [Metamycoplasma neophronis]|uniref:Restriction endonuclease n=1 Tax=Metamycoplasma neophronis TaxID=872983 RepID=A0ABY2Z2W8_9BACT|nr:restriction endonuclease [Metamycoplasma neophronis]
MDALIKCDNFREKFIELLRKVPSVITTFPLLFALSKKERQEIESIHKDFDVIDIKTKELLSYKFWLDKSNLTDLEIEKYYEFFLKVGLKNLFDNFLEKSTIDYVTGILVGLDSNGRKNRSGFIFELMCQNVLLKLQKELDFKLYSQIKLSKIDEIKDYIDEDFSNKRMDFVIIKKNKVIDIECNFFNDAGSKPEEIIESYINRKNELAKKGIDFILITDGKNCWKDEEKTQLHKAFKYLNILNMYMAENGYLEKKIKEILSD